MMNKVLCFLLSLFLFSCNQEDFLDSANPIENSIQKKAGNYDSEFDVLGMSYDATEGFLNDMAVKLPVIDLKKLTRDRIIISKATEGKPYFQYGETSEDYVRNISKDRNFSFKIGNTDLSNTLFSGSISKNSHFKYNYSYSSQYSFASCDYVKRIRQLKLNATPSLLRQYLTQTFVQDLNNLSPDNFVKTYGTHLLYDISIGGRVNIMYRSLIIKEFSSATKTQTVKAGINSQLLKMGVPNDINMNTEETESLNKNNHSAMLYVSYYGGDGINTTFNPATGVPVLDLNKWESSIDYEKNAALTFINWPEAIPIYELIADNTKKEQIKQATIKYVESKKLEMPHVLPVHQSWNGRDHFYATEYKPSYGNNEWHYEYTSFSVFATQAPKTVPLYQYWSGKDHLYTRIHSPQGLGEWKLEYILGYVYPEYIPGSVPLYQSWNGKDHFYTTEYKPSYGNGEWKNEGAICYVLPL